jgi:LAGLIDADG endonuclease
MESIIKYLGIGKIYKYPGKLVVSINIIKYTDITEVIIPFFNKYPIYGIKLYDYQN